MDKNIFQAKQKHTSTIIFLHGLGQNKYAGETFFDDKTREKFSQTKFIFPQASFPNSWYGIEGNLWEIQTVIPLTEVDKRVKLNKDELLKSGLEINEIIQQEIDAGISPQNIMVVGYSQGASMALAVGLVSPHSLGGVCCLAGFLPCRQEVLELAKNKDKKTPILICHGEQDTTVAYWLAKKSAEILKDNSYLVEFRGYSGIGHWLGEKGIGDMKNFLLKNITTQEPIIPSKREHEESDDNDIPKQPTPKRPKTKKSDDESENTIESGQTTPSEKEEQQIQVEEPPKVYPVQSGSNSNHEEIISEIEENLKKNKVSMKELDSQAQTDYQNIKDNKDNANLVNENINKLGAKKRIEKLREKVKKLAKSGKKKVKKLKEKLLKIIHSKNKYDQEYKAQAQNLLDQLENIKQTHEPSSTNFSTSWVVGGGILAVIGLASTLIYKKKQAKKIKN